MKKKMSSDFSGEEEKKRVNIMDDRRTRKSFVSFVS